MPGNNPLSKAMEHMAELSNKRVAVLDEIAAEQQQVLDGIAEAAGQTVVACLEGAADMGNNGLARAYAGSEDSANEGSVGHASMDGFNAAFSELTTGIPDADEVSSYDVPSLFPLGFNYAIDKIDEGGLGGIATIADTVHKLASEHSQIVVQVAGPTEAHPDIVLPLGPGQLSFNVSEVDNGTVLDLTAPHCGNQDHLTLARMAVSCPQIESKEGEEGGLVVTASYAIAGMRMAADYKFLIGVTSPEFDKWVLLGQGDESEGFDEGTYVPALKVANILNRADCEDMGPDQLCELVSPAALHAAADQIAAYLSDVSNRDVRAEVGNDAQIELPVPVGEHTDVNYFFPETLLMSIVEAARLDDEYTEFVKSRIKELERRAKRDARDSVKVDKLKTSKSDTQEDR